VAGGLPGEEVDAGVEEVRKNFWRGRTIEVLEASADRTLAPSEACPGCDWDHYEPGAALAAKRSLFLETMQRIGRIPPETFGDLPIAGSPLAYRIRSRFHASGRGDALVLGQFAPRSHRIEPVAACRALTPQAAAQLPRLRDALASSGAGVTELATIENPAGDRRLARAVLAESGKRQSRAEAQAVIAALAPSFTGVRVVDKDGRTLAEAGEPRLEIEVAGRPFLVSADTFFQGNRHLAGALSDDVARASGGPPGVALDAFGGVGFFAGSLLDAGHSVTSVEGSAPAARDAARTRPRWEDADQWRIVPSSVEDFLSSSTRRFDVVVADPPRAGLAGLTVPLGDRARRTFIAISCEPATLARDLPHLMNGGFEISSARLYDLFPLTHRVEAIVTLSRRAGSA
jgi:tRNA/tmRNA/rRNA uracil-C5-methylase (TrmA/RlmC/RlmD family)